MSRRPPKPAPVVVKRGAEERKRLPPELEAFARSDEEKLRIRRPRVDRGRVYDPREGYCIPGVANRDARAVYDQRVAAMQQLWQGGAADETARAELGLLFLDAQRLGLWRARRVMGFEPFAEEVVGVPADQARKLAEEATLRVRESNAQLSEREVALWMRTEAGLYEGDASARARIRHGADGSAMLELSVALAHASAALAGAGAKHLPLARAEEEKLNGRGALQAGALTEGEAAGEQDQEHEEPLAQVDAEHGEPNAGGAVLGGARLLTRKPRKQPEGDGARDEREGAWGKRRAQGDGEGGGGPGRRFEVRDSRSGGAGRGFGGKREGSFGGKRQGGFAGTREGGFGGKREGGFSGKRQGGFVGKREGGFAGKATKNGAAFGKQTKLRAKGKAQGFGQKRVFQRPEGARSAREPGSGGGERE